MCYKCANVKRRRGCNKKTVQKEWLEDLVVRETMKLIQDDAVIDKFGFVQLYRTKNQRFHVRNCWIFLLVGWPHLVLTTILATMRRFYIAIKSGQPFCSCPPGDIECIICSETRKPSYRIYSICRSLVFMPIFS